MEKHSEYPSIPSEQIRDLRFRKASAEQLAAIRERMRNISRGGVTVATDKPEDIDSIAEVSFRRDSSSPLVQAVGLVVGVDTDPVSATIKFIRVNAPASQRTHHGATPPATSVYAEGPMLVLTGEFGSSVYNGFVSCWANTLNANSDRLIIDLSGVSRISSMGVGLLMGAHMDAIKNDKNLTIKVPVAFQRMLSVAGMDKVVRFVYVDTSRPGMDDPDPAEGITPQTMIGGEEPPEDAAEESPVDVADMIDMGKDARDPVAEAEDILRQDLESSRQQNGDE